MKLAELKQMSDALGLQPTPTRHRTNPDRLECSMEDYTKAIQQYYLQERKVNGTYDPSIEFMLSMKSPMLAMLIKHHPQDIQKKIWDDSDNQWVFQKKIDGNRILISYDANRKQFHFYSRNLSQVDLLPIDYADKIVIPPLNNQIIDNLQSFVLDCEVIPANGEVTDDRVKADSQLNVVSSILQYLPEESHHIQETNPLKFISFDCLQFNNELLIDKPMIKRFDYLVKLEKIIELAGFPVELIESKPDNMTKEEYYNYIIDDGGEGVVAKDTTATYDILGKRDGRWTKIKRSASETLSRLSGDTVDAFVSGFTRGTPGTKNENKVGALIFSVYLTDDNNQLLYNEQGLPVIHEIAQISGLTDELRDMLTFYDEDTDTLELNPRFYNQVAEVDGQDISSQTMKLMHPVMRVWRPDRDASTCLIKKSVLESMIL